MTIVFSDVIDRPIDPSHIEALVRHPATGATVLFTGVVRDNDDGRPVIALDYEAHPVASATLKELLARWQADHPDVLKAAAVHRYGSLHVGDVAFCACVSAAHRAAAFAACADLVDRVKAQLPVWKRQHFADGVSEWVGVADAVG